MKLLRYGPSGNERPGLLDGDGRIRDLSGIISDIDGSVLSRERLDSLARLDWAALPVVADGVRIGPCVGSVGKIVCAGLNYRDHAAEAGLPLPSEPTLFMKATSSICGPYDDVEMPQGATKLDWEVELGIVIGKTAKCVTSAEEALDHIAGYCILNDVSERSYQTERQGQWTKGKSYDTFCPLGPWLVTRDEVTDPQGLDIWLEVEGKRMQSASTAEMVCGVAALVQYISQFMTLVPGDVVATGTPAGVGLGQKPPTFLADGQIMSLGISGLGVQRQRVRGL